jgi:Transposase DDE domain
MKISRKLAEFASQMGRGCSRPLYKFLRDMLTGMVAKKSIMLSDIGRALNEPIDLLYTEKRLSRNLTHGKLDDNAVRERYLESTARDTKDAVIAFDLSDVRKEYSKYQPYLAGIWDDSRKEQAQGYWLTVVEAVRPDGKHIPLWLEAWSQKRPEFKSQNMQIIEAIEKVAAHADRSATWVFDRGFDNPTVMAACDAAGITFVIRQVGKRTIFDAAGSKGHTYEIASQIPTPYRFVWRAIRHGKSYPFEYRCGSSIVVFPNGQKRQLLVMQQSRFSEPIMLLSNSFNTDRENVIRLCSAYLRRWTIEEATRAIKQCFELENLRPLTWTGIRRMVLFAFLAWAFLCKVAKTIRSKNAKIFGMCKWFGETPEFFYYRLAEAMALLLLLDGLKN